MAKTQQIWTIRAFPFSVPQRSCREWATAILCARTADPCAPFVWEELKRHLRTCEACQEVYANYPVIEALIGELFVYLSDDARAALLEVRPTVAPDEIPAAPEVPITTAFAQLWHAWQECEQECDQEGETGLLVANSPAAAICAGEGNVTAIRELPRQNEHTSQNRSELFRDPVIATSRVFRGRSKAAHHKDVHQRWLFQLRLVVVPIVRQLIVFMMFIRQYLYRVVLLIKNSAKIAHYTTAMGAVARRIHPVLSLNMRCNHPCWSFMVWLTKPIASISHVGALVIALVATFASLLLEDLLESLSVSHHVFVTLGGTIIAAIVLLTTYLVSVSIDPPESAREWMNSTTIDDIRQYKPLNGGELGIRDSNTRATFHSRSMFNLAVEQLRTGNLVGAHNTLLSLNMRRRIPLDLRVEILRNLAVTWRRQGKFSQASEALEALERLLNSAHTFSPTKIRLLQVGISVDRGTIAVRQGNTTDARELYRQSQEAYRRLAPSTPEEGNDIRMGLGTATLHLARTALFQGDLVDALDYCKLAKAYFASAEKSSDRDEALQRTRELTAWAYARRGQFKHAIILHTAARGAAERAHDAVNVMKNWVYLGDDYRHIIESRLDTLRHSVVRYRFASPKTLLGYLRAAEPWQERTTNGQPLHAISYLIDNATEAYSTALLLCEGQGDPLLLGKCLRNMAAIHRWAGAYVDAELLLNRARQHAEDFQQHWLLPSIYEAEAELQWDQGRLDAAARAYSRVVELLDRSEQQNNLQPHRRQRVMHALEAMHNSVRSLSMGETIDQDIKRAIAEMVDLQGWNAWQQVVEQLLKVVRGAIVRTGSVPIVYSDEAPEWFAALECFERLPGGRILAQNGLSVSLALSLPATDYSDAVRRSQRRRRALLRRHVEHAQRGIIINDCGTADEFTEERGAENPILVNRDLCCRSYVEADLAKRSTRERLQVGLQLMESYPDGYTMKMVNFLLPLAFTAKSTRVLLEIPPKIADILQLRGDGELSASASDHDSKGREQWCYVIDDENLAVELQTMFETLTTLAASDIATIEWMRALVDDADKWSSGCSSSTT